MASFVSSVHLNHCKIICNHDLSCIMHFSLLLCVLSFFFKSQKSFKGYKPEPSTNEGPFEFFFLCVLANFSFLLTKPDVVFSSNDWFIFLELLSWLQLLDRDLINCLAFLFYSFLTYPIYQKPVFILIDCLASSVFHIRSSSVTLL